MFSCLYSRYIVIFKQENVKKYLPAEKSAQSIFNIGLLRFIQRDKL